jgi:RNase H-fold protein (predicted Holliday junction resolvase)
MITIIAVDPGRDKCGVAVVGESGILHREISSRKHTAAAVLRLIAQFSVDCIVIGNGTGSRKLREDLQAHGASVPMEFVDETHSSRRARARFFQENPPSGLRRLIPRGLLVPNRPYDDYAAVILAEEDLTSKGPSR